MKDSRINIELCGRCRAGIVAGGLCSQGCEFDGAGMSGRPIIVQQYQIVGETNFPAGRGASGEEPKEESGREAGASGVEAEGKKTPSDIETILHQEDFERMFCVDCGKKPEEHTLNLNNLCHNSSAVRVSYSGGRLYVDCFVCHKGIAIVQVAKKGTKVSDLHIRKVEALGRVADAASALVKQNEDPWKENLCAKCKTHPRVKALNEALADLQEVQKGFSHSFDNPGPGVIKVDPEDKW